MTRATRKRVARHHRWVERVGRVVSHPLAAFALVGFALLWIVVNLLEMHYGARLVDRPPFFVLQGVLGLYGALVATSVFAIQHRARLEAERRSELELQVNLLSEQKATKIISLLEELRRDLPIVKDRVDPEVAEFEKRIDPHQVASALDARAGDRPTESTPTPSSVAPAIKK